jgi:two-component system, OmpR family, response regulator VanR
MSANKGTILVVDDEKDLRDIYNLKLVNHGYAVLSADNGAKALKIVAGANHIDLILLDVVMPQMSGFEVLEKLKSRVDSKKIPVFMLTNLGMPSEQKEGLRLKADKYLIKTAMSPDKIVDVVNQFLQKK